MAFKHIRVSEIHIHSPRQHVILVVDDFAWRELVEEIQRNELAEHIYRNTRSGVAREIV